MKNKFNISVKDHAVSGELFELKKDDTWGWLETTPRPSEEDIERYYESEDYISHTDSKRNLFERAYHWVREKNLRNKLNLLNDQPLNGKKLLDYGCGTGEFLSKAQNDKWDITGLEPNEKARKIANEKTHERVFDLERIKDLPEKAFDAITLWHVLEHCHNPLQDLNTFHRLLSDTGSLIIAVPNYKSFDASYYKEHWAGYDVPRHLWHFSTEAISKIAEACNFKVAQKTPMMFDAYYVSLLSEKYRSGWMNPFTAFFVATRSNLKAARTGEYSSLIYVLRKANSQ